jgi:hypothetical protein
MMVEHHSSWIFSWRRRFHRRWHLLIVSVVLVPMACILYSVMRVSVFASVAPAAKQADILLVADDSTNHDVLVHLSQKTPFPLRPDLAEIESLSAADLNEAARTEIFPPSMLREIPIKRSRRAFDVALVLPTIDPEVDKAEKQRLPYMPQPRVRLISAQGSPLPISWPLFVISSQPPAELRYMIHITEHGFVDQCQSIETDASKRLFGIDAWLLSLRYPAGKNQPTGWFTCEIEWINFAP